MKAKWITTNDIQKSEGLTRGSLALLVNGDIVEIVRPMNAERTEFLVGIVEINELDFDLVEYLNN